MAETTCPICGGGLGSRFGVQGALEDGQRELYCSDECRDRAESMKNRQSASRSRWKAPESFSSDSTDPFAE